MVLGMHRSGTSATARSLQTLGIRLGGRLMEPAANNEKGFYEDLDLVALNEEMLQVCGRKWDSLEPLREVDVDLLCSNGYLLRAVSLLRDKLGDDPAFGFKDPRTARLLPFWQRVFLSADFNVRYVMAYRNPLSVVRSLEHRDGFDSAKSFLLTADYLLSCLNLAQGSQLMMIDYDCLVNEPREELEKLSEYLDMPLDEQAVSDFCDDFLSEELRHSRFRPDDLQLDVKAVSLLKEIHAAIHAALQAGEGLQSAQMTEQIARWKEEFRRWVPLLKLHDDLEANLRQRASEMVVQAARMSRLSEEVAGLTQVLESRDAQLLALRQDIALLEAAQAELRHQNAVLHEASLEKDRHAAQLVGDLSQANHVIRELLSSTSWRISWPVRALGSLLRKPLHGARVAGSYFREYPLATIVSKTLAVLSREGPRGIKARVLHKHGQLQRQAGMRGGNQPLLTEARLHRMPSQSYAGLMTLDLAVIDVLSLDVFDTAIIRLYDTPEGIFEYVGQKLGKQEFISSRTQAESKARQQNAHRKDISLESIYQNLDIDAELEAAAELMFCVVNPEVFELYRRALAAGKKVMFVSDMYLPRELIEEILQRAGYSVYEGLYVSSDDDLIKGDGSRFESLKKSHPGMKFLHVGDNYMADVYWPAHLGMRSHHYSSAEEFYQSDQLIGTQYQQLRMDASIGIRYLLGVYRYWKNGFKTTTTSFWRDVGFFYGGPLLHAFAVFLNRQLTAIPDAGRVYFLARDGRIMKTVYETLYGEEGERLKYLYASRRCMTFPLLSLGNAKQDNRILDQYSLCEAETTAQSIFDMFGYPELEQLRKDLFDLERKGGGLATHDVRAVIKRNLDAIRPHASEEADALLAYLDTEQILQDKPVLVDVGWSGTIQDSIDALLDARLKHKPQIHGIYIGVRPNAAGLERKVGFLFDSDSPALAEQILRHYVDFIELLTASEEDGVQRIVECDGQFQPSYQLSTDDEELRKRISRQIQMGAHEYACLVKRGGDKDIPVLTPHDFSVLFDSLRHYASEQVIAEFDAVKHSRVVGGPHSHDIIYFDRRG